MNALDLVIAKLQEAKKAIEEYNEVIGLDNHNDEYIEQLNDMIGYHQEVKSFGY